MGFNISGLVINKNYASEIQNLEKILGEELIFDKEVTFDTASENWKDEDYCDIYFSKDGTLIFISMDKAAFEFNINSQKAFSFALSEMTMTFAVNLTDNGKVIRSFVETENGNRHGETGEKLPFENSEEDASELIHHLIKATLGQSYWDIDLEEKCLRYSYKSKNEKNTHIKDKIKNRAIRNEKKSWWKFW